MMVIYSSDVDYEMDKKNNAVLKQILFHCKKFEGKDITKRITTHLKEMMPEYHIFSDGTSFTVYENQNWKMQFCLPMDKVWNSEAIYNRTAIAYGIAAEERIKQYEAYLISSEKGMIENLDSEILQLEKKIEELKKNQNEILKNFMSKQ
jgi:hypothetical protein